MYPAMNSSSRDTPRREKERKRRQDKTKYAPSYAPRIQGRAVREGGVAAEVIELVVVEICALMGTALTCLFLWSYGCFCSMAASSCDNFDVTFY